MAKKVELPAGAPKYSDVCFSSRVQRIRNEQDTLDTFEAARAFHVDNMYWVYTSKPEFMQQVADSGYALQVALSPTMTDLPLGSSNREKGRVINPKGERITAPWMASRQAWWGCVNHPDFQATYWEHMKRALDAGVRSFQVDDPAMGELLRREEYDSVCHCDYCEAKADSLGKKVGEIQAASVLEFHEQMRQKAKNYTGEAVSFSCNNFRGVWDLFPFDFFDFGIAEAPVRRGNPEYVYASIREAHRRGKAQVFSYISNRDWLIKMMIASTYASGGNLLVPWDVWRADNLPRFYGEVEKYAPYYAFIQANQQWLNGYEDAFYTNTQIDPRYLNINELPIHFPEYRAGIHAYARAIPNNENAPVIIHLVDWENLNDNFEIFLEESFFFESGIQKIELLTPVAFDKPKHEYASEHGNYDSLVKSTELSFERVEGRLKVEIPRLGFYWGILVVR